MGAHLLERLLAHGYTRIHALHRAESSFQLVQPFHDQITWHTGDLDDIDLLEDLMDTHTAVFHCAGLVSYQPRDRDRLYRVNVEGTANVVNAALQKQVYKLIHVSSIAALGRRKGLSLIDENIQWEHHPYNSNYGVSKHLGELEVWRGVAEGLRAVIVNPSIIVGAGFWDRGTARFFRNIAHGFPFYPTGGSGFVDVQDCAEAMICLLQSKVEGERFILNGENRSYRSYFERIADGLGVKRPAIAARPWMGAIAWRLSWLRNLIAPSSGNITRETVANGSRTWQFDTSKFRSAFPEFQFTPLDETIQRVAQRYRSEEI